MLRSDQLSNCRLHPLSHSFRLPCSRVQTISRQDIVLVFGVPLSGLCVRPCQPTPTKGLYFGGDGPSRWSHQGIHALLGCHQGALNAEKSKAISIERLCALLRGLTCNGCTWAGVEQCGPEKDCIDMQQQVCLNLSEPLLDLPEPVHCCMVALRICLQQLLHTLL